MPSTPRRTAARLRARPPGVIVGDSTANSSPPSRNARAARGRRCDSCSASARSSASPRRWPERSLTSLNRSTSSSASEQVPSVAASAASNARPFSRPVSGIAGRLLAGVGEEARVLDQQRRMPHEQLHPPHRVHRRQLPVERVVDPDEAEHLAGAGGERQEQRVPAPAAGAGAVVARAVQVQRGDLVDRAERQQVRVRDAVLRDHRVLRQRQGHRPAQQPQAVARAGHAADEPAGVIEQADRRRTPSRTTPARPSLARVRISASSRPAARDSDRYCSSSASRWPTAASLDASAASSAEAACVASSATDAELLRRRDAAVRGIVGGDHGHDLAVPVAQCDVEHVARPPRVRHVQHRLLLDHHAPLERVPERRVGRHQVDAIRPLVHRVADDQEALRPVLLTDEAGRLLAAADHEGHLEPVVGGPPQVHGDRHPEHRVHGLGQRREHAVGIARRGEAARPSQGVFGSGTHVPGIYGDPGPELEAGRSISSITLRSGSRT